MQACSGIRTLAVPLCPTPLTSEDISSSVSPAEIVLGSYADLAPEPFMFGYSTMTSNVSLVNYNKSVFRGVSHLRVGDPSDGWYSPSSMLTSFGPLPHLTHLQLSRRAHANMDNDTLFVGEIQEILRSRTDLKMLVAAVYPSTRMNSRDVEAHDGFRTLPDEDKDCNIWSALRELSLEDDRLVIVEGTWGSWAREWEHPKIAATGSPAFDFWTSAKRRAQVAASGSE